MPLRIFYQQTFKHFLGRSNHLTFQSTKTKGVGIMVFKVSNRFALTKQILHNKAIPQIAENHSAIKVGRKLRRNLPIYLLCLNPLRLIIFGRVSNLHVSPVIYLLNGIVIFNMFTMDVVGRQPRTTTTTTTTTIIIIIRITNGEKGTSCLTVTTSIRAFNRPILSMHHR